MKIGIIGATGMAGQEIYREAVTRGEDTSAIVRDGAKARQMFGANAQIIEKDAFDLSAADLAGFDAIVDAFGTSPEQADSHNDLVRQLVAAAPSSSPTSPGSILSSVSPPRRSPIPAYSSPNSRARS